MTLDLNNHISVVSNDDVKKILKKYFAKKKIDINHLNYIHKYKDGSVFYLCSNHKWIKHYLKSGYMHIGAFETKPFLTKERYVLWDSLDKDDVILKDSREIINVDHGMTVINKSKKGVGYFNFGNNDGGISSLNTYINKLDALNEFIPYFYQEAKSIIDEASNQRIIVNSPTDIAIISNYPELSARETECINWYLKGKNSGEIALILGISRRTVETHIENIKNKFECKNLCQLGYHFAAIKHSTQGFIPEL